jgi:glycerophosphoryl diester phosphodiesterase
VLCACVFLCLWCVCAGGFLCDDAGNLWDHTIEQIELLDAGSSFSTSDVGERIPKLMIAGEKVPRLTALLELCRELSLGLNLEVKHVTEQSYMAPTAQEQQMEEELADIVCDTIEASKVQPNALIFSSFSRPAIAVLRRRLPHFCCGFLVEEIPDDWEAFMALHQCASLNFWWKHAGNTQARIQECTSKVPCYSYTVNDGCVAARLLSWGVSGVFSDCPHVVSMALDDAHVAS